MELKKAGFVFFPAVIFFLVGLLLFGADTGDTVFLTQPALSSSTIAFVYAGDLWTADTDGGNPRKLTSDLGLESSPVFSPDGRFLAFSAEYDGNTDVYMIPAEGGIPRRLTWHPYPDAVQSFTPDGKKVLFTSSRYSFTGSWSHLFEIPVEGGFPERIEIPYVYRATLAPDGQAIAYNPLRDSFLQWKNYRGGTVSTIVIYKKGNPSVEKIPQPEGRCNDPGPVWIGGKIYFRSDRNGEFNLFAYDTKSKEIEQLTNHKDFPVVNASGGAGRIIYEQAGKLHVFDPATRSSTRLRIGLATDLPEVRDRFVKGSRYIRNASLSPSGARAVFEFRGEILTVPAEKGDFRNITATPGVHERSPVWSPDGKSIAYFSDESGEYELYVKSQDGKGEAKKYKLAGAGFYVLAVWSPDGRKIAFVDNSWSLFWIDLETGQVKKIASEYLFGPSEMLSLSPSWSPDSKWIAYTLNTRTYIQKVYVYSLSKDQSLAVTDGLSEVSEPVFDKSGKYLYFFSSTDAGPVKQWFDMSNADMDMTSSLYVTVLRKDLPNPLARESDEEQLAGKKAGEPKAAMAEKEAKPARPADVSVSIDFEDINQRIVALPVPSAGYRSLQAGEEGQIYYLENQPRDRRQGAKLHKFDFKNRKDEVILENVTGYMLSSDAKKMMYLSRGTWSIVPVSGKIQPGQGKLDTDGIEIKIDPRAEWNQIFHEAWRINRDYFYDPNMHGCDWRAMRDKYAKFLPHLACRSDLNRLIQWMCSELAVGHHRVGGGDFLAQPRRVPVGLLGADYEIAGGRYRFKKVYGGLNWNPELRSPLTEPGVDVKAGEYLLTVNGRDLRPPVNLFAAFENTADKIVEIAVGPSPDGKNGRTVKVVPVASENALRNRDWVEGNLRKVEEATGGRVAYVYVPNTSNLGHTYFKRYFFPQADKEAIIVDERHNGGGQVADYYIDHLRKPYMCMWAMRYGSDLKTPSASIQGPKVMLINETAGSGGDLLPWMFRKLRLGPLIGKRTWGGLVGTLGFPVLMDGGYVTAPNLAIWTEEGFIVENEGVPPDIEVDITPADYQAGRDPQLEKAVETIMDMLKKNPPKKPVKPAYPTRVRK